MVVEAAVFGGERRLDQIVRKIFQRNRVIVLDAAAADRIAVAVEEGHRQVGLLQPVLVGGFAEGGHREREQQDQPAEPDGGGFRQRLDEDPALPAADIEAVHEGRVALIELACALARREQGGVDARVQIQKEIPEFLLHMRRYDLARHWNSSRASKMVEHAIAGVFDVLLECCGKPKARLVNQRHWIRFCCSRAGAINQWSDQAFNEQDERLFGPKRRSFGVRLASAPPNHLRTAHPASRWNT